MTGFTGQLTTKGLNGCMTFAWPTVSVTAYVVHAFFVVKTRTYAIFKAVIS
jgi:hypothetical protein